MNLKILLTRKATWVDPNTGETETDRYDWGTTWALAGIHSWRWAWVRRRGALPCGCTRNPVTRRMVLYAMDCDSHGSGKKIRDAIADLKARGELPEL